jgi:hypothetical protein
MTVFDLCLGLRIAMAIGLCGTMRGPLTGSLASPSHWFQSRPTAPPHGPRMLIRICRLPSPIPLTSTLSFLAFRDLISSGPYLSDISRGRLPIGYDVAAYCGSNHPSECQICFMALGSNGEERWRAEPLAIHP